MDPTPANDEVLRKLQELCYPSSVAVLGASESVVKWGSLLTTNLLYGKFEGPIYPINPRIKTLLGLPVYPDLAACPGPVDLAFITLPAAKVIAAVRECAAKGVKNVVIISSGFSEIGAAGAELEKELVAEVRRGGMRMIGPNTMGIISGYQSVYSTGSLAVPPRGGISMISQSGNLGTQVVAWAEEQGVGINKFFGTGNEGDINSTDLLRYLAHDDSTKAVLAYIEGIDDGRTFLKVAREAAIRKPVVMLKSGRTIEGSKAASSHTGALSGSHAIWKGAMRQAGVFLVNNPMDLIDGAAGMQYLPMPRGYRVCVVTLGGGWGVVASDLCRENGLRLPPLPKTVIERLDKILPPFWSRANPIDLVGQIDLHTYSEAFSAAAESDEYDAVITLGCIGSSAYAFDIIKTIHEISPESANDAMVEQFRSLSDEMEKAIRNDIVRLTKQYGKPIVNVSLDKRHSKIILPADNDECIVAFNTPEKAVRVLAGLSYYSAWRKWALSQRAGKV